MKIDDITDFKKVFESNSVNLQKYAVTAASVIGAAAVVAPAAFIAAPAIGGALGVGLGYSGAVATKVGLATLGGGAIAAGGMGMAGGVAVVSAAGAALGGTLGAVISQSYFGDLDGFEIELIKPGVGDKVVFIDGFLTEKKTEPTDWKAALAKTHPNNPWYYVRWESKRLYNIGESLSLNGGHVAMAATIGKWAVSASKQAGSKLNGVGGVLSALGLAVNPWSVAMIKAAQAGVLLADSIARTSDTYILCGHSLGARVIYYALEALSTKEDKFIKDVHLLGGAVGNEYNDWDGALSSCAGFVNNYYSENDRVLATMYKVGTLFRSNPIGRNPIPINHTRIRNVDVSTYVAGHTEYKNAFGAYCVV